MDLVVVWFGESTGELIEFSRDEMKAMTEIQLARRHGLSLRKWAAGPSALKGLYEEYDPEHPAPSMVG
ncbi:hypothetical protein BH23CHL10_BH23CHL10_13650 [soil metagenome]